MSSRGRGTDQQLQRVLVLRDQRLASAAPPRNACTVVAGLCLAHVQLARRCRWQSRLRARSSVARLLVVVAVAIDRPSRSAAECQPGGGDFADEQHLRRVARFFARQIGLKRLFALIAQATEQVDLPRRNADDWPDRYRRGAWYGDAARPPPRRRFGLRSAASRAPSAKVALALPSIVGNRSALRAPNCARLCATFATAMRKSRLFVSDSSINFCAACGSTKKSRQATSAGATAEGIAPG